MPANPKLPGDLRAEHQAQQTRIALLEAALRESEARHHSVLAAIDAGVVFQLADGSIYAWNASAERILGLNADQMRGRTSIDPHWRAIRADGSPFPGESHPAMVTLSSGKPCANVLMGVYKPDGGLTWMIVSSQPLFHPDASAPYAVVASFTDITEYKRLEDERESLITQLNEILKRADALYVLTALVNSSQDLSTVLQAVVENAASALPAHRTVLITIDTAAQVVLQQIEAGPGALHVAMLSFEELSEGLSGVVLREGRPVLSRKGRHDTRESMRVQERRARDQAGSILVVPIRSQSTMFGTLTAINAPDGADFTTGDLELLAALANQAAVAIERVALLNELQQLATTDGLTQLLNRRAWLEQSRHVVALAQRAGRPVAVMLIDADHFKQVNDNYGHDTGDRVLQVISRTCQQQVRADDLVGRYGGEEFVVLLSNADSHAALVVAERLRQAIASTEVPLPTGVLRVTISVGVATLQSEGGSLAAMLTHADQALYTAKQAGRNQVCGM